VLVDPVIVKDCACVLVDAAPEQALIEYNPETEVDKTGVGACVIVTLVVAITVVGAVERVMVQI
jgi:hypothetical protein